MKLPGFGFVRSHSECRKIKRIHGHVDRLDVDQISGWVIGPNGAPQISLNIAGVPREAPVECHERPDVAAIYGSLASLSGFKINLSGLIPDDENAAGEVLAQVEIRADGILLKPSVDAIMPGEFREQIGIRTNTSSLTAELTAWRGFILEAWVNNCSTIAPDIVVKIDGRIIDCSIIRLPSNEWTQCAKRRLLIEIPGSVWSDICSEGHCLIHIEADGVSISKGLQPLTRLQAAKRVNSLFCGGSFPFKEHDRFLALEHVKYSGLWPILRQRTQHAIVEFCSRYNLHHFLELPPIDDVAALAQFGDRDWGTKTLDFALRDFNKALVDRKTSIFEAFKQIKCHYGLNGPLAESFLLAATPALCMHRQFDQVRQLGEAQAFERLCQDPDPWKRSSALAYLVLVGRVNAAAELLSDLAKGDSEWFNTECIRYALELVHEARISGKLGENEANQFVWAFLNFLGHLGDEWTSRLHDLNLVNALIHTMADLDLMSEWMARALVKAALRHYGLSPGFWEVLATHVEISSLTVEGGLLLRAHAHFEVVGAAIDRGWPNSAEGIDKLRTALRFFQRHENPEAIIFLREFAMNLLAHSEGVEHPLLINGFIDDLLAVDADEAVRVMAFPGERARKAAEANIELSSQVFDRLRALSSRPKSSLYGIQIEAAAILAKQTLAAEDVQRLTLLAGALNNWEAQFLGCDVLLSAIQRMSRSAAGGETLCWSSGRATWMLRESLLRVVSETDESHVLPAAVVATLARLRVLEGGDAIRGSLSAELEEALFNRFENKIIFRALEAPAAPSMMTTREGSPHDTLVIIYSCRKHLGTRVRAIRDSWIKDLQARAIPYLIVVGDGDNQLHDDVLELATPDGYEDLPKKTLAMLDWVYRNTDTQYLLKVDDDCRLDVGRYFGALSFRKFHYYGRSLTRGVGGTDRAWHQSKSRSAIARSALDKSPEPSSYADGGGAYSLSRLAIAAALKNVGTPEGQELIASSFSEDKLIGDLLAQCGILAADEDYYCDIRRKPAHLARAVSVFETSFSASPITPTMLTHFDGPVPTNLDALQSEVPSLRPSTIWPSYSRVNVSLNSNRLEYLSPDDRLLLLSTKAPIVVAVVRNEMIMIPHFLDHYRRLGVETFLIADNLSSDGTQEYLLSQPDVLTYSVDTEYKCSIYGVAWQQALLSNHCMGKWVLIADADELLIYEDCERQSLAAFVTRLEQLGANACATHLVDMYPRDDIDGADFGKTSPFVAAPWFDAPAFLEWRYSTGKYGNSSHLSNALRHRLLPNCRPTDFTAQKFGLFRYAPWIRLSEGIHYVGNVKLSETRSYFAHFKYHAGFAAKIREETRRKQHFNNASEYQRYLCLLTEGKGMFCDSEVSRRYKDSRSFTGLVACNSYSG